MKKLLKAYLQLKDFNHRPRVNLGGLGGLTMCEIEGAIIDALFTMVGIQEEGTPVLKGHDAPYNFSRDWYHMNLYDFMATLDRPYIKHIDKIQDCLLDLASESKDEMNGNIQGGKRFNP